MTGKFFLLCCEYSIHNIQFEYKLHYLRFFELFRCIHLLLISGSASSKGKYLFYFMTCSINNVLPLSQAAFKGSNENLQGDKSSE